MSRSNDLARKGNWAGLKKLALKEFRHLREQFPLQTAEALIESVGLKKTKLFMKLAQEAGFSPAEDLKEQRQEGYGEQPYGITPYGRFRGTSDGRNAVRRRITSNGQFSYRGRLYNLGRKSAGNIAVLVEQRDRLFVNVPSIGLINLALRP